MKKINISEFDNKKTALVLSGGVVKAAAWHLGVSLALEDIGFTFKSNKSESSPFVISTYVGSSAGSLINIYLASGFKPIDIIDATIHRDKTKLKPISYKDMLSRKSPMDRPAKSSFYDPLDGLPTLLKKVLNPIMTIPGFFTTQGLHDYINENVLHSNNFNDYEADLFVVATQLDHSRKVIFSKYNYPNPGHDSTACYYTGVPIADTISASMSVPPFYAPYPIKNIQTNDVDYYIDGEIRETLSTHVAVDNQCEYIISSWTHTPYHFHDEIGSLVNYGLPAICLQAIYLIIQKKIIGSRAKRNTAADIINTVNQYMSEQKFSNQHRKKIISILERKLDYKPNVKLIDIYPDHKNYEIFFRNSFSLNPSKTSELVSAGYKKTIDVFRKAEWQN